MREKKIPVKNLYLIFLICIGLVCLGVGSTYALFTVSAEITNPIVLASNLTYESSLMETISVTVPAGETVSSTLNVTNNSGESLSYVVYYLDESLDIELGTSSGSPTGSLVSGGTTTVVVDIRNNTESEVTVILGILSSGQDVVLGGGMTMVPSSALKNPVNLITHITNLYTNATKTTATNNSITYNYASDIGLMNDRLGTTDVEADAGNIRYYGADPNNYIYYNCEDYSNPTSDTCELWRIIGVFKDIEVIEDGTTVTKDMVKIARASTIGTYAWDNKASGLGTNTATTNYGSNDWTDARLMMLLNPGYDVDVTDSSGNLLNEHGRSYYWNSGSGSCYSGSNNATTTCDFTSTGLKNDETRNMIAKVVWKLGGWNTASGVYPNKLYEYERGSTVYTGRATEWEGHVALMYPSDYGYATDFTKCDKVPYNYDSSTDSYACRTNDWLFISGTIQWLLTPASSYSYGAWFVNSSGGVDGNRGVYNTFGVRPVLYLDSEIDIESGNAGTSTDPYRISLR